MSTYLEKRSKNLTRGILLAVILGLTVTLGLTGLTGWASAQEGIWVTKTSMPAATASSGGSGGVIGGRLFVVGGTTPSGFPTGSNEMYNRETDTWTSKAPDLVKRGLAASAVIGGILFVAGGCLNSDCNSPTNQLTAYDPQTDTWTTKASMPTARGGAAGVAINGLLYVVGGQTTCCAGSMLPTLEVYDPLSDTWTTKMSMPTARSTASAAEIGGELFVAGGNCAGIAGCPALSSCNCLTGALEVYDPTTDTWTTKASEPTAEAAGVAGVIGGMLHVVGVTNTAGVPIVHEVYNRQTDTWTTEAPPPTVRSNPVAGVIGGRLFVAGGAVAGLPGVAAFTGVLEVFIPHP